MQKAEIRITLVSAFSFLALDLNPDA